MPACLANATVCYIWIAGLHHSGTSLVHSEVGARPGVARLDLARNEGEGGHDQHVYRSYSRREGCATSLTAGGTKYAVSEATARYFCAKHLLWDDDHGASRGALAAAWAPLWTAAAAPYRVEKDPDFGSAFVKARLFEDASLAVFVMRHPFVTASVETNLKLVSLAQNEVFPDLVP